MKWLFEFPTFRRFLNYGSEFFRTHDNLIPTFVIRLIM